MCGGDSVLVNNSDQKHLRVKHMIDNILHKSSGARSTPLFE